MMILYCLNSLPDIQSMRRVVVGLPSPSRLSIFIFQLGAVWLRSVSDSILHFMLHILLLGTEGNVCQFLWPAQSGMEMFARHARRIKGRIKWSLGTTDPGNLDPDGSWKFWANCSPVFSIEIATGVNYYYYYILLSTLFPVRSSALALSNDFLCNLHHLSSPRWFGFLGNPDHPFLHTDRMIKRLLRLLYLTG
jgi:hypothetical protein